MCVTYAAEISDITETDILAHVFINVGLRSKDRFLASCHFAPVIKVVER
jgi:hypothetical protein